MEKNYERRRPATGSGEGKPVRAPRPRTSGKPRRNFEHRDGEHRDYEHRERREGEHRDYSSRPRRSYERREGERRDYSDRPRRSYERREGEHRDYSDRPRRSYERREGEHRDYSDRPRRSYERREDGHRDYSRTEGGRRPQGDRRPGAKSDRRGERGNERRPGRSYEREYTRRTDYSQHQKPQRQKEESEENVFGSSVVRLNKFIANSGVCSRREADQFIQTGLVTVNGQVVTELGTKVNVNDDIRFNGERLKGEKKVYVLMNKPKDYITSLSDPHADQTVIDLISQYDCPQRIYPVGRLDKATTGVLMLTNDGELAEMLTHPSNEVKKIYHVFLDKALKQSDFDSVLEGFELEDGEIHADALSYVDGDTTQVGIEIHSGRNRIVRRIFESLGYNVKKLDRVYFAGLTKKNLPRGHWRFLTDQEVAMLKAGMVR